MMPRRKFQQRNQKKVWSNSNCFENKFWFVFIIQCIMKVLLYPRFKEEGLFYLSPSGRNIFSSNFPSQLHITATWYLVCGFNQGSFIAFTEFRPVGRLLPVYRLWPPKKYLWVYDCPTDPILTPYPSTFYSIF